MTYITFPYNSSNDIQTEIYNSIGGLIESIHSFQIQNDICEIGLNTSNYSADICLVKIKSGDKYYTKNLVVNP
jgi:hypothetical protein